MKRPNKSDFGLKWKDFPIKPSFIDKEYMASLEKYCDYLESLLSESQVLTGDDADRFADMIRNGLNKPSGPALTPKLDRARDIMRVKYRQLTPDVPCPKCGNDHTVRCCEQCGETFDDSE